MLAFNEKTHAFIAAKFYEYMVNEFADKGKEAFIHATRYYAEQRGRRMAQRAIRDGQALTYETYCKYGEWVNTKEMINEGLRNKGKILQSSPDLIMKISSCPWRAQFKEMNHDEAGIVYCTYLDYSIMRGFNPEIVYEVNLDNLLNDGYCIHKIKDDLTSNPNLEKNKENILGFEYHCAHSYWSYSEVAESVFGYEGKKISTKVIQDFGDKYGKEYADTLMKYKFTNFNVIY